MVASVAFATLSQASLPMRVAAAGGVGSRATAVAEVTGAHPSVSDDARFVVFEGRPTDGSERARTVWLRDTGTTGTGTDTDTDIGTGSTDIELTALADGVPSGDSVRPAISGDGCVVVTVTQMAYDLFRDDDTGERWDVYRLVLPHCGGTPGDWELVSTQSSSTGDTSALDRVWPGEAPSLSQVGTVIAFTYQARDGKDPLLAAGVVDATVPLGADGRSSQVAGSPLLAPNTTFRYIGVREPDVSDSGRYVAFTADADAAAAMPEWGTGPVPGGFATSQVFLWDRESAGSVESVGSVGSAGSVALVSGVDGTPSIEGASAPVVSGNGGFVAFQSTSSDLAGDAVLPMCGDVCPPQVYRFDATTGGLVLVSALLGEAPADGAANGGASGSDRRPVLAADLGATSPAISDDGTQVGFVTRARNLFVTQSAAGAEPADGDIVVSEVDRQLLRRVSTLADGVTPAAAGSANPQLTGSGHRIVFDTLAAAELTGDPTPGRQVVMLSRTAQPVAPALEVGTVSVLLPSDEWFISVRNDGPSTFMPSTVTTDNPDFRITGGTCQLQLPVPPGQGCSVEVVLRPRAPGAVLGTLTVSEAFVGGASVTTPLSGTGGEPALEPTPSGLDFDATAVGVQSTPRSADIANIGFGPAAVTSIEVTGLNPDDFVVTDDSCIGFALNPGSTCALEVAFAPTEAGLRTATVLVGTAAGQFTAVLVAAEGTRVPDLDVADDKVRAGNDIGLGGAGFRPSSPVTVSWADGRGASLTLTTSAEGSFLAWFPTSGNERSGDRVLVAQSADGAATAEMRITRRPASD